MQGLSEYQGQLIFVLEPGEKVSSDEENEKLYLRPNFAFDPSVSFCVRKDTVEGPIKLHTLFSLFKQNVTKVKNVT